MTDVTHSSDVIERIEDPETTSRENLAWHLARYHFAASLVEPGDRVLDAGCGVGYGTGVLAGAGGTVWGCDVAPGAVAAARRRGEPGRFAVADLHDLPYADGSFDGVVSFEVLEHLLDPGRFLDHVRRVLVTGGWFVVTTPNPAYEVDNPHHRHELDLDELRGLLEPRFSSVTLLGQPWAAVAEPAGWGSRLRDADRLRVRRLLPASARHRLRRWGRADGRSVAAGDLDRLAVRPFDDLAGANPYVALCRR